MYPVWEYHSGIQYNQLKTPITAEIKGQKTIQGVARWEFGRTTRTRTVDPLHVMQVL